MRTSLTLESKLAIALAERARVDGLSFDEALDRALCRGLSRGVEPQSERFRVEAKARGVRRGLDLGRLNQLCDETASSP